MADVSFARHTIGTTGGNFQASTDLADIDGDGDLDFMVGYRQGGRELFWFEYRGAGDWQRHKIGGNNTDVGGSACDLDGDGDQDAVAGALWFENTGAGSFRSGGIAGGDGNAHDTVCADINGDGVLDVVSMSNRSTEWYEHDGSFSFNEHHIGPGEHGGVAPMGARDIDGDGDVDVASVEGWFENTRSGEDWEFHDDFYEGSFGAPYGDMIRTWLVDLDQDGDTDAVTTIGDIKNGSADWWENIDGANTFQKHTIDNDVRDLHTLGVADFDNDGDWDVFSCEGPLGGDRVFVWLNQDGAGGNWQRSVAHSGEECHEGVVGDVDNDGDVDIAFKPWNRGESVFLENILNRGGGLGVADGTEAAAGSGSDGSNDDAVGTLLVFSKTDGWRHASIPAGIEMLQELAAAHSFQVDFTQDAAAFTAGTLTKYDGVVFLNTTEDVLNAAQQQAFQSWYRGGGAFIGIHAATDTEYDWPWYGELVGAYFDSHPQNPNVRRAALAIEHATHPSTAHLPSPWRISDEWYNFQQNPRSRVNVLLSLDESSYSGGSMGDHPIAWYQEFDGGRSWYTGLGHAAAIYDNQHYRRHVLGGIEWALGVRNSEESGTGASSGIKSACNLITQGSQLPQGFAAPYNVLSARQEMLVSVTCSNTSATLSVGTDNNLQYVYQLAYAWRANQWQQVNLTGTNKVGGAWYVGSAQGQLPHTATELTQNNFVVAYVCTWTGTNWQCGCRDQQCAQGMWQLQVFRR